MSYSFASSKNIDWLFTMVIVMNYLLGERYQYRHSQKYLKVVIYMLSIDFCKWWDPVRGVPGSWLPLKFDPFLPAPWIILLVLPKIIFYAPFYFPWTFVNLLPELKSVLKHTIGALLCKNAERSKRSENNSFTTLLVHGFMAKQP